MIPTNDRTPWWWLSFADLARPKGQQFLGGVLLRADNGAFALTESHWRGLNPGGEVQMVGPIDAGHRVPERFTYRILSLEEINEMERVMGREIGS